MIRYISVGIQIGKSELVGRKKISLRTLFVCLTWATARVQGWTLSRPWHQRNDDELLECSILQGVTSDNKASKPGKRRIRIGKRTCCLNQPTLISIKIFKSGDGVQVRALNTWINRRTRNSKGNESDSWIVKLLSALTNNSNGQKSVNRSWSTF